MNKDLTRLKYVYMPPMDRLQSLVTISAIFIDTNDKGGVDYYIRINALDVNKQIEEHRKHHPKLSKFANYEFDPDGDKWLEEKLLENKVAKAFDSFDECIDYFYEQHPGLKDEN